MALRQQLRPGFKIFFLGIWFEKTVHSIGLGFTDIVYGYAVARSQNEAIDLAHKKYRGKGIPKIRKVSASVARSQNLSRYCFPEKMAGIRLGATTH